MAFLVITLTTTGSTAAVKVALFDAAFFERNFLLNEKSVLCWNEYFLNE